MMQKGLIFLLTYFLLSISVYGQFPTKVDCKSFCDTLNGNFQYLHYDICDVYEWKDEGYDQTDQVKSSFDFKIKNDFDNLCFSLNDVYFICECRDDPEHIKSYDCYNNLGETINLVMEEEFLFFRKSLVNNNIYEILYLFIK